MTMDELIARHEQLSRELRLALSTMERKSTINGLYVELNNLQRQCPHVSEKHNYEYVDGYCPYCGKKLEEMRND